MQPNELAQLERFLSRREQRSSLDRLGRDQARVNALSAGLRKLETRIQAEPGHPKIELWKARCNEYRQSLINWHKFGQEAEPTEAKPGVTINVPLGELLGKLGRE